MVVCFLIRSLDIGGSQTQIRALAAGLARHGHEVHLVQFFDVDAGRAVEGGVFLHGLGKRSRYQLVGPAWRLIRILRNIRPDILHAYLPAANVVAALFRPLMPPLRLVWGVRAARMDLRPYDRLSRLPYRLQRLLAGRADLVICNSSAARADLVREGMAPDRLRVVPNGIDSARFAPDRAAGDRVRAAWGVGKDDLLVGQVGRLDPVKGVETFLEAAARVAANRADVRFVCVGGGEPGYAATLRGHAKELGIADRVIWAGSRDDMAAVYNAFDFFVCASLAESFPNALAEAMACGVPCVATDVGDVHALLRGSAGLIVPPADAEALADALARLLDRDAAGRAEMGRVGRGMIVTDYNLDFLVDRSEALLSDLTGADAPGRGNA